MPARIAPQVPFAPRHSVRLRSGRYVPGTASAGASSRLQAANQWKQPLSFPARRPSTLLPTLRLHSSALRKPRGEADCAPECDSVPLRSVTLRSAPLRLAGRADRRKPNAGGNWGPGGPCPTRPQTPNPPACLPRTSHRVTITRSRAGCRSRFLRPATLGKKPINPHGMRHDTHKE
jgi:hypothetical protein